MIYEEFMTNEFGPRCIAALTSIRTQLIAAGVSESRITPVANFEQDTEDMRFAISASTGQGGNTRTITAYIELTDATRFGQPGLGKAFITLFAQTNQGAQLAHTYTPGNFEFYTDAAGIDALRAKLTQLESAIPRLITSARQFLRV